MTRSSTRTQAACLKSVEAESVQRMLRTSYKDFLRPRVNPVTGAPVWPIQRVGEQKCQ